MKTIIATLLLAITAIATAAKPGKESNLLGRFMSDTRKALVTTTDKPNMVNPKSGLVKKESVYVIDGYRYTLWYIDWNEKPDEFRIYVRKNGTKGNDNLDGISLGTDSNEPTMIMVGDKSWDKEHHQHPEKPSEDLAQFAQSHLTRLTTFLSK